ncbi:MAG: phage portal protein [Caulobacteraceae bacterium]
MSDTPAAIAQNPNAPTDERYDAQAAFQRAGLPDFIPAGDLQPVIDFINDQYEGGALAKGGPALSLGRADPRQDPGAAFPGAARSVILDEFQVCALGDYWDRPGLLGFEGMKAMVEQTPILNGIVLTRIRQVSRFCRPQTGRAQAGFIIEPVGKAAELGPEQRRSIELLERFISNCGWEDDPRQRKRMKRDSFAQFMAKSVRDTLTMDASPIETTFKRDRNLGLDGFVAVDGSTIRLCSEQGYDGDDEVFAVQLVQGQIRTAYTYDQLVYEVRNPRTDVTACGYGYSETEMLIKVVTYLLNTMTYNGSFFDKNSIPRGILQLFGDYGQSDVLAFKRYWNAMQQGVSHAHNLPVLVSKDRESGAQFTQVGGQLDEMAFGKWLSFLTSVACAIYGVAPEEISMESYGTRGSSLGDNDIEERLVSSQDKGLRPLLGFYENLFSDFIIRTFSSDYCFRFVGLDADEERQRFEMRKLVLTWNEARRQEGEDAIAGPLGDMPLNPSFIEPWLQVSGAGQGAVGDGMAAPGDVVAGGLGE